MQRFNPVVFLILLAGTSAAAGDAKRVSPSVSLPAWGYSIEGSHVFGFSNMISAVAAHAGSEGPVAIANIKQTAAVARFDHVTDRKNQ